MSQIDYICIFFSHIIVLLAFVSLFLFLIFLQHLHLKKWYCICTFLTTLDIPCIHNIYSFHLNLMHTFPLQYCSYHKYQYSFDKVYNIICVFTNRTLLMALNKLSLLTYYITCTQWVNIQYLACLESTELVDWLSHMYTMG